jgi:hypothetical protein
MEWLRSWFKPTPNPVDGRPTPRQLAKIQKSSAVKTKRRRTFAVDNPSVVELTERINAHRQKNPYGVCGVCNKNTHITEDHDAVMKLARQKAQSKRKRTIAAVGMKKRRGHKWTVKRRPPPKRKPIEISPFTCLDESMRSRYQFNKAEFEEAWTLVTRCINEAPYPGLLYAVSQDGQHVMESDRINRVYRDDWPGCCPDEVKHIARDMAQEFIGNGIITYQVLSKGPVYLYCAICYAVVRIYLDQLEWEDVHMTAEFHNCMFDADMNVSLIGERLVNAIITDEIICDRMQLGEYSRRIVDAVRYEGEGEGEGVGEE